MEKTYEDFLFAIDRLKFLIIAGGLGYLAFQAEREGIIELAVFYGFFYYFR